MKISFIVLMSTLLILMTGSVMNAQYTVTRQDLFAHGSIGHAHTNASVKFRKDTSTLGGTPQLFFPDAPASNTITPSGLSGVLQAQVTFATPSSGTTLWFDLPTVAGDYRTSSVVTYYPPGYPSVPCYGYSARFNLTATNTYKFSVTRFECMGTGIGPMSKIQELNNSKPVLYPNPGNGFSEIEYMGIKGEEMRLIVTDINGRMIRVYTTTLNVGINKLAIDVQNEAAGTYFIKWETNTGNNGVFRMIKK